MNTLLVVPWVVPVVLNLKGFIKGNKLNIKHIKMMNM